jgi:hypothetical protein
MCGGRLLMVMVSVSPLENRWVKPDGSISGVDDTMLTAASPPMFGWPSYRSPVGLFGFVLRRRARITYASFAVGETE